MKKTIQSLTAFIGFMRLKLAEQRGSFSTDDTPPADPPSDPPADDAPPPDDAPPGDDDTPTPGDDAPPEPDKTVPLKALEDERRKRQKLERRVQALETPPQKTEQEPDPATVIPPGFRAKPVVDQFETYDDYVDSLTDWKTDLKFAQRDYQAKTVQHKTEQQKVESAHMERMIAAQTAHPDFEAVMEANKDMFLTYALINAAKESDVSGEVFYHLVKNPKDVERLNALPERAMLRELGKIEAKLSDAPAPKKHTGAPPPIAPVGGGGSPTTGEPSNVDDWARKERERCMRERGRPY